MGSDVSDSFGVGCDLGVEFVEGFAVVGGRRWGFLAFELSQRFDIPVEQVVSEHAYGVIFRSGVIGTFGFGNPAGLLGGEAGDGGVDGDEPLSLVVGGAELSEQNGFQR